MTTFIPVGIPDISEVTPRNKFDPLSLRKMGTSFCSSHCMLTLMANDYSLNVSIDWCDHFSRIIPFLWDYG